MQNLNRRAFLKNAALAAAAVSLPARSWAAVPGANEDIRIAVVGFHGRGQSHIDAFSKMPGVRITALCDVDRDVLNKEAGKFKKAGKDVESYTDIRKLLESKNVDAVSIATPNHWHSLGAIGAAQAGKDVYVEKPVSHNIWEGRKAVEAARKYNRIIQAGTQTRSSHAVPQAIEWLRAGNLGKILVARGFCYKPRASIGKTSGPQPVPTAVDYDLWCGPAPLTPPHRNSPTFGTIHYDWHWFWNYGNGDLGNQGVHQVDLARWFLGENDLPPRAWSVGGRLGYEDDGETPNTQMIFLDYKVPLIFEVRGLPEKSGSTQMDKYKGMRIAAIIECEGGFLRVPGMEGQTHHTVEACSSDGKVIKTFEGGEDHFANFIKAVRSRKVSDSNCDILEGHISSALCHVANISYRLGKQAKQDEIREQVKADRDAVNTFERMAGHLQANRVDLDKTKATLGEFLNIDVKAERFINNPGAGKLLTRNYRAPFVVPEKI